MSYLLNVEPQKEYEYDEFAEMVRTIERQFTDEICKSIRGRDIYVLLPGAFCLNYFEKTTVSDAKYVSGKINFNAIIQREGVDNLFFYSVKEPGKKDFRGKIKYTPKNTLSVSLKIIVTRETCTKEELMKNQDIHLETVGWDRMPWLQDENFVNQFCDNAYNCDENGVDYDYLERHAFRLLTNDKRFRCGEDYTMKHLEEEQAVSKDLHYLICNIFDVENSWSVVYCYNGNNFIFPMRREYIQRIFKFRDKENGRRKTIASIVNGYTRKSGVRVDGHLRTAPMFSVDGREYTLIIGPEDFGRIFPTKRACEKIKKKIENGIDVGGDKGFVGIR